MKGYCKNTAAIVIIFVQINSNFCWIYNGSNKGFTAVPANLGNGKEKIYLDQNGISYINDDSFNETFTDLGKVYHMELSENRIINVSEKAFAGFQRLKFLNLKNNKIKNVTFKVEDIPQLEIMSIENNHLKILPTFCGIFTSLGEIYLSGNFISHVDGDDFENITNINYIDLSNNGLVSFEPVRELLGIWSLILDSNNLTKIPDLQGTVSSVELRNNQISFVGGEYLKETDSSYVHSIYLSENRIEHVSERAFAGLQELETLYLNKNRIRNIILKAVDVPKLETLDIKNNQLTQSPIFYGVFPSFRHINLVGNLISHISTDDFKNITNVEWSNLSFNSLTLFEPKQELSHLSVLDLANNNLKEIPALQGTYNSLQQLYLQHNNISLKSLLKLKKNINWSEQSLNSLFLGGNGEFANNLAAVINFFEQFPNLSKIGLSNLNISKMFIMSNVLGELDLSGNNISEISEEFFSHSKLLEYFSLTLDNNPIENLPNLYEYVKSLDSYEVAVSLREMKLNCYDLCWMTETG